MLVGGWDSMREAFEWHKVKPSAQGAYFGVKRIEMTVGNPRKLP